MHRRCNICGRPLGIEADPLSIDCGGDCWGCVGPMEDGWPESVARVAEEIRTGLREPDGTAKPPPTETGFPLSEYERQAITAIALGDARRDILLAQLATASCTKRDYTGVGLYTELFVAPDAPMLDSNLWMFEHMPKGDAWHPALSAGAGLILWLRDGRMTCLESYTYDGAWPEDESLFRFADQQA